MKFTITLMAALASIAAAASKECTPGTYACTSDAKGWQVCDVSGKFVVSSFMSYRLATKRDANNTQF